MPAMRSAQARKQAKQRRSRVTVDAIVEAAARVVSQVGLDRANTNRIAEVAGVSIGSLYQYFPGKTALMAAVIEREADADLDAMRTVFADCRALPLGDTIDRTIEHFVRRFARSPALYRWMLTYVPALGQHPRVRMIASKGRGLLCDLLVERRSELAPGVDPALAAMILGSAVEAAAHNAVFERTDTLTNGALARELSTMCRRYLLP
jgi:AcrR family transcriptional regulator